jgi:hypothetical protein
MSDAGHCESCGAEMGAGARYCRHCGTASAGGETDAHAEAARAKSEPSVAPAAYATPAHSGPPPASKNQGWLIGGVAVAVLASVGIGVGIFLVVSRGSGEPPKLLAVPAPPAVVAPHLTDTASPHVNPPPAHATPTPRSPSARTALPGAPAVNGRDSSGFNYGPGCSDNPSSSLPGCSDSPSIPNGDTEGSCPNGITVDQQTTSCGLAENVYVNYKTDGLVTARSPERGQDYTFTCTTAGAGTTGYRVCLGQAGDSPLYLRWHP